MKKEIKRPKLRLSKETLRGLSLSDLQLARGGATTTSDRCTTASDPTNGTMCCTGGTVYCGTGGTTTARC
jgi:hypothetical protein